MNLPEKFVRFAAECEHMAEFTHDTHDPENKTRVDANGGKVASVC
jgi:hypothetical protein